MNSFKIYIYNSYKITYKQKMIDMRISKKIIDRFVTKKKKKSETKQYKKQVFDF